jgi:glycosyltransferase involved in cell wall biosynthesis
VTRVRILRVIARTNVGGPALQVAALTTGLDPDRFETKLLVGRIGDAEADYLPLRADDVAPLRVPGLGRDPHAFGDARALATLVREMRAFRPHIVHTHTAKAGVLGRVAARIARVPATVHTFHGHLLHGYFSPTVTRAVVATERLLASRTTRLVAVGERVRDELLAERIGRPEQYHVVPPGVTVAAAPERDAARHALGLPLDRPVVGFVARLTAVKRPDRFAEVARRVATTDPDVEFVVAGGGELLDDLRGRLHDLGERVHFLGWRADVETVYGALDVCVLTSDNEGMPVSLIEAAHCGVPAVAPDVGSVAEVVRDGMTGIVTSTEMSDIAAAVSTLVRDPPRRAQLGGAAAVHARRRFGVARLVRDTEALYDGIVRTSIDQSRDATIAATRSTNAPA